MRTSKIKIHAMTIPYLTDSNGERYWPMRPLCEAIELNWHSQAAKLQPPEIVRPIAWGGAQQCTNDVELVEFAKWSVWQVCGVKVTRQ
ncbi:hypothetical protein PSOLE_27440 [Pseudomonas oleovorans subsp. oleovorans]|uniref:P22_AR N-terminal domain n=1 Tax=Ectopseudomonas oleovorans TaxID=301 RepID=A0A379JR62_ECTOL|nr:hypothetical protein [Pseudomonas oleovorans]OWK44226.1 hypothetical protein PSOLE_27440 [Pseudomonas oleovorans subsp. oleovorans]SEJ11772.1 P22_AR N-terminal domain-containing protein [Pseudomonas oleovorans]SUD50711.1 P22_AR N-terminal domain [Pseudomonas oleovorans]